MTEELALLREIRDIMAELLALSKSKRAAAPALVASDADLDGPHGDPVVKFLPRDWTGDDFRQQTFSQCTPTFLDALANAYDYFAAKKKAENDPKAKWEDLSAARARGWSARLKAGWKPKAAEMPSEKEIVW
jgi:hypothetical protein